jgi:hypothetical protein
MVSEIHSNNIATVTLEETLKVACKAFEEHQRVAKEHSETAKARKLQEFLPCFKKD